MKPEWQRRRLGDVASLSGRIGWRGLTAKEYTREGPLFLSVHSLNYGDHVDFQEAFHISQARYDESPEIMLRGGDVLICKDGAGIGKLGIVGELPGPATINSSLLLIRAGEHIRPKFLYHCLCSPYFQRIVQSRLNGATTPHLYQRDITEFPVVIPTIAEQGRIVAILDEAFEGIATAKANAEQNLQNAREVFVLQRDAAFTEGMQCWPTKLLGEIADVQSGGTPLVSTKEFWGGEVAWYSSGELNEIETSEPERFITEAGLAGSNAKLFPKGALLVGMYDTAALKMSMLDRAAAFNQAIAGVKPNPRLETEFLFHAINFQKPALLSLRRGVRQKNLSLGKIKEVVVPIPSAQVQRDIVGRLRAAQELSNRLQTVYERKLDAFDELKKALLHRAFTGAMTAMTTEKQVAEVA